MFGYVREGLKDKNRNRGLGRSGGRQGRTSPNYCSHCECTLSGGAQTAATLTATSR